MEFVVKYNSVLIVYDELIYVGIVDGFEIMAL